MIEKEYKIYSERKMADCYWQPLLQVSTNMKEQLRLMAA
jgi:hypothetical protein